MGCFTLYDCVVGNPCGITCLNLSREKMKYYDWMNVVRVILKDGSVTDIGFYDDYGRVFVDGKEYKVADITSDLTEIEHDGIIIIDKVYEILSSFKEFPTFISENNLYDKIISKGWQPNLGNMKKYIFSQHIMVVPEENKNDYSACVVDGSPESIMFYDPDVCPENYDRVEELCISLLKL